jgi:hypothetical protein
VRFVVVAVLAASCGGGTERPEPEQIFQNREHGYSVGQPEGWTTSNDRGSTRFSPANGKQTIVVRSALRPNEIIEGKPTSNDDVIAATRKVLAQLSPRVGGPNPIDDAELTGVEFELTFKPPSVGTLYQRKHVVLFGQQRIFHVIWTAPQGEGFEEAAMRLVVSTLKEEA